jgi:hypothetical protein
MGHNRLGTLPDTKPWRRVVGYIAEGESVAVVAAATSAAAVTGLRRGQSDRGVGHVVFLLARMAVAARKEDFVGALATLGIRVPLEPTLFDLTAGFTAAMRAWYSTHRGTQTDLGEIAQLAACEAITASIGPRVRGLITQGNEIHQSVRDCSTKNGFAALAHDFFARFTRRFLLYHLGRELSQHVGGNGRFADHAAHTAFIADLEIHCREIALVVRVYSGAWYDKAKFEKGISEQQAMKFSAYCLGGKIAPELAIRGNRNG